MRRAVTHAMCPSTLRDPFLTLTKRYACCKFPEFRPFDLCNRSVTVSVPLCDAVLTVHHFRYLVVHALVPLHNRGGRGARAGGSEAGYTPSRAARDTRHTGPSAALCRGARPARPEERRH